MITVRILCNTGNYWVTSINGTESDAREYFLGQSFDRLVDGTEIVETCTSVEVL